MTCSKPTAYNGAATLQEFIRSRSSTDKRVQKWTSYLPTYERYFGPLRGCDVNILELGVQSGGSQEMWLHFFGPMAHSYGVDMEAKVLAFNNARITNMIGDIGSAAFLESVCDRIPRLDVIIDDASHISWHMIFAFRKLWPCLKPGGLYLVEDIESSYKLRAPFNGGPRIPGTFIEFAKATVDDLQAFWSCPVSPSMNHNLRCHEGQESGVRPSNVTRTMQGMYVHDGIVVFEKALQPKVPAANMDGGGLMLKKRFQAYEGAVDGKPALR